MNRQRAKEKGASYAWDNRGSANCSVAAWVFRISCHIGIDSHCFGGCGDFADSAFRQRPIGRLEPRTTFIGLSCRVKKQNGVMFGMA
jgi:hypothetical protein